MILLLAFVFALLLQLYFYLFVFGGYAFRKADKLRGKHAYGENLPGVSVIVAARNEAENLGENLELIARQDYADFEIILINDGSSDQTGSILLSFKKKWHRADRPVLVLEIPPGDSKGKKTALTKGIEIASKELVLLTDADCRPNSRHWIHNMASRVQGETELVLGYGAYKKIRGSFLNRLIRFETLLTAVQYFSYASLGFPYMGVGRNMAYTRDLFSRSRGFEKHMHVKSGDDDLFVSEVATADNTVICDLADAFTLSEPKRSYRDWIRQKRRHITTASHYKTLLKVSLASFYLSQVGFYVLAVILLFSGIFPAIVLPLIALRFVVFYAVLYRSSTKLEEKDLLSFAPLYEISVIFMQLHVFTLNKVYPPKHW